jgi:hypothetical protein
MSQLNLAFARRLPPSMENIMENFQFNIPYHVRVADITMADM